MSQLISNLSSECPSSPMFDACWMIKLKIDEWYSGNKWFSGQESMVIAVTSAGQGEGKSSIAANLASTYACQNKKVLIIDANLGRPVLHKIFSFSNRIGMSNLRTDRHDAIRSTSVRNLSLLAAGPKVNHSSSILTSSTFQEMLKQLRQEYDLIVVDTPPIFESTAAQIAASISDGVLVVMRQGIVKRDAALRMKSMLDQVNATLLGVVFNCANHYA